MHGRPGGNPYGWMFAALVVVAAAAVVIALVLHGTIAGPSASTSSPTAPTSVSMSVSMSSPTTSPSASITAPTTDDLPSNAQSGSCAVDVPPSLVAVSIVAELEIVIDRKPDATQTAAFADCVSAPVRARLSQLYGVGFGVDYSGDLTGGDNHGPTARYTVPNAAGTATLSITLTRQSDGHYEVTDFAYG